MIDHDRLFKELISTFFREFIELFFPGVLSYVEANSITFLDKEVFTDVTEGEKHETDLIAQVKWKGKPSFFLIHIEAQSESRKGFEQRMFNYFARLHEKYAIPIYPIVIFSYESPQKQAVSQYEMIFPDFKVLDFNYRVIQLNRLNWRDFLNQPNPIASALMAKMKIKPTERAKVKAECLRLLVTLKLNPAKMQLISGFVDTYLRLEAEEEQEFQKEIANFNPQEQEKSMEIVTSWMLKGIEQGIEREKELIIRQIKRKFGNIENDLQSQIKALKIEDVETLGEDLFDLASIDDLKQWLNNLSS